MGIDWAESFHDIALGRPGDGIIQQFRIDHTAAGVERLITRCLELETDPADVRVVLETRHGVLVEALTDAGFTVLPVNYDTKIRAGKAHHSALRALANRWLEILWHCLTTDTHYDETIHIRNRTKALQPPTAA